MFHLIAFLRHIVINSRNKTWPTYLFIDVWRWCQGWNVRLTLTISFVIFIHWAVEKNFWNQYSERISEKKTWRLSSTSWTQLELKPGAHASQVFSLVRNWHETFSSSMSSKLSREPFLPWHFVSITMYCLFYQLWKDWFSAAGLTWKVFFHIEAVLKLDFVETWYH